MSNRLSEKCRPKKYCCHTEAVASKSSHKNLFVQRCFVSLPNNKALLAFVYLSSLLCVFSLTFKDKRYFIRGIQNDLFNILLEGSIAVCPLVFCCKFSNRRRTKMATPMKRTLTALRRAKCYSLLVRKRSKSVLNTIAQVFWCLFKSYRQDFNILTRIILIPVIRS